jgi:hypothetical protein
MPLRRFLAILAMALILTGPALAADWVVTRLRGDVQFLDATGAWQPLKRGDVVPRDQMIRTLANGHAELSRSKEVVTLGANTQLRIEDDTETGYTTVLQDFGRVEVDAEAKRVKHFEVRTPFLAAVVKGTHFVVTSSNEGASVAVDRGAVAVQSVATERSTLIGIGQTATVKRKNDLVVGGIGPWPPVVDPGVRRLTINGSLGGARTTLSALDTTNPSSDIAVVMPTSGSSGAVRVITASASSHLFGFSAGQPKSTTAPEPTTPLNPVIVLIGALLGAAMGAVALLLRRGI